MAVTINQGHGKGHGNPNNVESEVPSEGTLTDEMIAQNNDVRLNDGQTVHQLESETTDTNPTGTSVAELEAQAQAQADAEMQQAENVSLPAEQQQPSTSVEAPAQSTENSGENKTVAEPAAAPVEAPASAETEAVPQDSAPVNFSAGIPTPEAKPEIAEPSSDYEAFYSVVTSDCIIQFSTDGIRVYKNGEVMWTLSPSAPSQPEAPQGHVFDGDVTINGKLTVTGEVEADSFR